MSKVFISYNREDLQWAEWIAWQLEEEKYEVTIQAWDFKAGSNFVLGGIFFVSHVFIRFVG